jgi:dCMP deaminase
MNKWHESFLKIAQEISTHSTCIRKQVGVVLVVNKRIISTGYNGVPSGFQHCKDFFKDKMNDENFKQVHGIWSEQQEIHGEANCLMYASKYGIKTDGALLYTTISPCLSCSKLIIASGVKEVYYLEEYDRDENNGLTLLKKADIKVNHFIL